MSTFDIRNDSPYLLNYEAINITLKFERTSETTGRISWNIPSPTAGCTADDQAYCGILLTIDNTPVDRSKVPTDGNVYNSDPTADNQLFAGDKIGTSMVVGAFYNDRKTTFLDVTGLKPNTPYYVNGFPADCQYRYYRQGIFAYSLNFNSRANLQEATSATQNINITNKDGTERGINPTDLTGLICGVNYDMKVQIGGVITRPRAPLNEPPCIDSGIIYTINVDGCKANTFQEMVDEINRQFAMKSDCPQSAFPPNTGAYYYNTQSNQLFQWDGYKHVQLPIILDLSTPNIQSIGDYWLQPETGTLYIWDGASWNPVNVINYPTAPTSPECDKSIWFDGTTGRVWNGYAWCDLTTYTSNVDPSLVQPAPCGSYWYKPSTKQMHKWNDSLEMWLTTNVIKSPQNPNGFTTGFYWFNKTNNKLYQYNIPNVGWNEQSNVRIQETQPTLPGLNTFWYNPMSETLKQWDGVNWISLSDFTSFPVDPTNRSTCDLWWDTLNNLLFVWNAADLLWVEASPFYQQEQDPTTPPLINDQDLWFNPTTNILYQYINFCWKQIVYIDWPSNPINTLPNGTGWFNGTNYYIWNGTEWDLINPTKSLTDPYVVATGAYWFNVQNNTLNMWNGGNWINLMYSTTPLTPTKGTCWYDQTLGRLREWNGETWANKTPIASVEIDCNGNLLFSDNKKGGESYIRIVDMPSYGTLIQGLIDNGYTIQLELPRPGGDAVTSEPMYEQEGVGTDGSNDERLQLMAEVRFALGYPTIDVELTQEQLYYAISQALQVFRQHAAIAYKRGFFFMNVRSETQRYILSNRTQQYERIVQIMGIYRLTSAFLSSAHGAGVYGQIVLQHLYNMGTFDLLSYHIIAEYVELMEVLFAARLTFTWNEQSRELFIHHRFPFAERMVLIEASVERTEQTLLSDRYTRPWIRKYTIATAKLMLAEIRGKYASLPGAGGGVSLNASDLRASATEEIKECMEEIEQFVVDQPEEFGMATQFIMG